MMESLETEFPYPSNVVNGRGIRPQADSDSVFLERIFDGLKEKMREDFHRFTFVVHQWAFGQIRGNKAIPLDPGSADRILILTADEREVFPVEDFCSYKAVFRAYGNPAGGTSNVHPFPVGYLNAVGGADPVTFDNRRHPVFFSGYLNRNRVDLYKQFRKTLWLPRRNLRNRYTKELARRAVERFCPERSFELEFPDALVSFTEWFGKGLAPDEYAKILSQTKIALCPPGFESSETIRHWEAMRLGCVVISAPLPPNRFYKGSPIIELQDWSELKPLLKDLLSHPDKLRQKHEETVAWWDRMCSEHAVADYMARVLEG
ncbi:MAG: hypothetical protein ABI162_01590 [Luteolibacter sp.]